MNEGTDRAQRQARESTPARRPSQPLCGTHVGSCMKVHTRRAVFLSCVLAVGCGGASSDSGPSTGA